MSNATPQDGRMFHAGEQAISERDFATFVIPLMGALLAHERGEEPPRYVKLSPRFEAFALTHAPKLWIGEDGRMRLAYVDERGEPDMDDVSIVEYMLRLDTWHMVMLHTDAEEVFALAADEVYSQV